MSESLARIQALILLLAIPLVSGWLAGFPRGFAELPPRAHGLDAPGYSPVIYLLLVILWLVVAAFLVAPRWFGFRLPGRSDFRAFWWVPAARSSGRFPRRGWIGLALLAAGWSAAWSHPSWLGWAADHTFFPLWLGYVLILDALTYRRAGISPLTRSPSRWLAWFPVSALTWWYFELLNRFVQNWVYLGVDHYPPWRYVAGATLAFSTVIPAVLSTAALLSSFDYFRHRFVRASPRSRAGPSPRAIWWWALAGGILGLAMVPWFPIALFPLSYCQIWCTGLIDQATFLLSAFFLTSIPSLNWTPSITLAR